MPRTISTPLRTFAAWAACFLAGLANAQEPRRPGALGVEQIPEEVHRELGLPPGAGVAVVSHRSPAENAGLKPGDVIVQCGGQPVRNFFELAQAVRSHNPGETVALEFLRQGERKTASAKLARRAESRSDDNLKAGLAFLPAPEKAGPATTLARARLRDLLSDRAGALKEVAAAAKAERFQDRGDLAAKHLELLFLNGKFGDYLTEAPAAAGRFGNDPRLQLAGAQAALAGGRHSEAEARARAAIDAALQNPPAWANEAGKAIRVAIDSRLRRGLPISGAEANDPNDGRFRSQELLTLAAWRDALGGLAPYQVEAPAGAEADLEFKSAQPLFGVIPSPMRGIEIAIDGHAMPLAIVDTGAAHTLVSAKFAAQAGLVPVGPKVEASGSMGFTAQSALVKELRIGPLVVRNVPVNIGDPPPLAMTQAKAALGVDLMHHLRFAIDYSRNRVRVRPARAAEPPDPEAWDIPLHAFAEHTFAEATLADGTSARTVIDSGNFAATLVWPRWGHEHLPGRRKPAASMAEFVRNKPVSEIAGLALGGKPLPPWPVLDMPPMTLQGVDLIDLLMGHDLLSQYIATIDMQGRRLRLRSPGGKFVPPKPPDRTLLKLLDKR